LPLRTREKLSACRALGLDYWADHPSAGCVWAVDGRQFHVVKIRPKDFLAQHVCDFTPGQCDVGIRQAAYVVGASAELLLATESVTRQEAS
jgi:hypothetical protein